MYPTLEHWVDEVQASGRYSFLRAEAIRGSGLSAEGVKKALQRLSRRGRVVKVKDYYFVIVPLEYRVARRASPATWFIDSLMQAIGLPSTSVCSARQLCMGRRTTNPRNFRCSPIGRFVHYRLAGRTFHFFSSRYVARSSTMMMKTPTGSIRISTPETTAVDLVRFEKVSATS